MKHSQRNPHSMRNFTPHFAVVLCSVMAGPMSAQGYHLGLNVAPNVSFADARELSHHPNGSAAHFGYGFIFDAMFTEYYAIGTGVNVFYTGGKSVHFESQTNAEGEFINRVELEQKLQYVELPLTFKMRTKEIGYTTYYGQFGVGFGLNVRADGTRTSTRFAEIDSTGAVLYVNEAPGATNQVSLVDETRLFRPSLIIGLGGERRFTGTTALAFGIRYNMALRNQYQAFPVYTSLSPEQLVLEYDESSGLDVPTQGEMRGKTGQIELCVGVMF